MANLFDEINKLTEQISSEWEKESELDISSLDTETQRFLKLHGKYMNKLRAAYNKRSLLNHAHNNIVAENQRKMSKGPAKEDFKQNKTAAELFVSNYCTTGSKWTSGEKTVQVNSIAEVGNARLALEAIQDQITILETIIKRINYIDKAIENSLGFQRFSNGIGGR